MSDIIVSVAVANRAITHQGERHPHGTELHMRLGAALYFYRLGNVGAVDADSQTWLELGELLTRAIPPRLKHSTPGAEESLGHAER